MPSSGIEIAPTSVIRIATTAAKIGRSMKNATKSGGRGPGASRAVSEWGGADKGPLTLARRGRCPTPGTGHPRYARMRRPSPYASDPSQPWVVKCPVATSDLLVSILDLLGEVRSTCLCEIEQRPQRFERAVVARVLARVG